MDQMVSNVKLQEIIFLSDCVGFRSLFVYSTEITTFSISPYTWKDNMSWAPTLERQHDLSSYFWKGSKSREYLSGIG